MISKAFINLYDFKIDIWKSCIIERTDVVSIYPLNKPQSSMDQGCNLWKEKMKFFIERTDCGICKVVNEGLFVPKLKINGIVENKPEKDWTRYDKKNVQCSLKAKVIIATTLGLDNFCVSFSLRDIKRNVKHPPNQP